jgi:hypothetical protein
MSVNATAATIRERVEELDWDDLAEQLDTNGRAVTPALLSDR